MNTVFKPQYISKLQRAAGSLRRAPAAHHVAIIKQLSQHIAKESDALTKQFWKSSDPVKAALVSQAQTILSPSSASGQALYRLRDSLHMTLESKQLDPSLRFQINAAGIEFDIRLCNYNQRIGTLRREVARTHVV